MDLEKILELLNDNEALKTDLLANLVNDDVVNNYLDSESGKKVLQPRMDRNFNKGLDSWKQNNLEKIMNEEIAKRFPNETPEQKQIRELKQQMEQIKQEATREKLTSQATELASKSGLPAALVKYFVGSTEEETRCNLDLFESEYKTQLDKTVVERTKGTTPSTPTQTTSTTDTKNMSFTDFISMQ
jgi:hypothetical protein